MILPDDKSIQSTRTVSDIPRRMFLKTSAIGATALSFAPLAEGAGVKSAFTLWQLPPQTKTQMNCYVIETRAGIVVIDGGNAGDAPYLKGFLGALGDHVSHWFISHPHSDHLDAVTAILRDPGRLKVDAIHGSFPAREWIARYEPDAEITLVSFNEVVRDRSLPYREHEPGETISFGGLRFEILGVKNPELTANPINNSSVVMRMTGGGKTVLFTGDLGVEGGDKLLKSRFRDKLRADWVQMAHHGQNGVTEEFYRAVKPSVCLWPTPDWLWDNDNGGGKGSGPWKTLSVRGWMDTLGVKKHYVSKDGLYRIEG